MNLLQNMPQQWAGSVGNLHQKPRKELPAIMESVVEGQDCVGIQLTHGKIAIVDRADLPIVQAHMWSVVKDYKMLYAKTKTTRMHRLIMGVTDPKVLVDHIDHDGLNNRRSNLRVASHQQNAFNRRKLKTGTTNYKGTALNRDKFRARIIVKGKVFNLGTFPTELEAAACYNAAAIKMFGPFAVLNTLPAT